MNRDREKAIEAMLVAAEEYSRRPVARWRAEQLVDAVLAALSVAEMMDPGLQASIDHIRRFIGHSYSAVLWDFERIVAALSPAEPGQELPVLDPDEQARHEQAMRELAALAFDPNSLDRTEPCPGWWGGHESPESKPSSLKCPDDGTCHHGCAEHYNGACWRVFNAEPLSVAGWGEKWPPRIKAAMQSRLTSLTGERHISVEDVL